MEVVEQACSAPNVVLGETLPNVAKDMDIYSIRQPLGVTAGITPFNFPAMIPLWVRAPLSSQRPGQENGAARCSHWPWYPGTRCC